MLFRSYVDFVREFIRNGYSLINAETTREKDGRTSYYLNNLYGIFVAADESVNKAYIIDISEKNKRGIALGAYNTAIGAAYLPASVVAGALWAVYGPLVPLSLAGVIALISAAAFLFCCK